MTRQVTDDCDDDVLHESVGRFCKHCHQHFHGRQLREPHPPIQDVVHLCGVRAGNVARKGMKGSADIKATAGGSGRAKNWTRSRKPGSGQTLSTFSTVQ
ncbi:hypothetical protein WJX79_002304 [Trebouxia sp. C0005]